MNVGELKKLIEDLPDDMEIILQKDAEGNGYSPLYRGDSNMIYIPECTWAGEVYSTEFTAEDMDMDQEEWEEYLQSPRVLVLVPVN